MKVVFHRWQCWLLAMFLVCLPVSFARANLGPNFGSDEYVGHVFAVRNFEFGTQSQTLKPVIDGTSARRAILAQNKTEDSRSKSERSILQRIGQPPVQKSQTIRSAVHGIRVAAKLAVANPALAKLTSSEKPAQPRIAEAVEFDRFSVKDFAESGFSPLCMFVDQSTSGSFLENRSEKTLVAKGNPIYNSDGMNWIVEPREADTYWQYYSDCADWDVVFAKPQTFATEAASSTLATETEAWTVALGYASRTGAEIYQFLRQAEFHAIETPATTPTLPVHETLIKGLKSVRPIIAGTLENGLVYESFLWNELQAGLEKMQRTSFGKSWIVKNWTKNIWTKIVSRSVFTGPIESNASVPQQPSSGKSRR